MAAGLRKMSSEDWKMKVSDFGLGRPSRWENYGSQQEGGDLRARLTYSRI